MKHQSILAVMSMMNENYILFFVRGGGGGRRVITKLFRFAKIIDDSGWPLRLHFQHPSEHHHPARISLFSASMGTAPPCKDLFIAALLITVISNQTSRISQSLAGVLVVLG